jgi:predicted HAD superfamily Cof-like phosphohydrolase
VNRTQQQVIEFHRAGGHLINDCPSLIGPRTLELRRKLIEEELDELLEAMYQESLSDIAKELADLLYVVYGTAISYGLDMEPISDEVHRSNMTKFSVAGAYAETCDQSGKSIRNAVGKTLKPPGYEPASLAPIIEQQSKGGVI